MANDVAEQQPAQADNEAAQADPLTQEQRADLENRFTYHSPKPGQPQTYEYLRERAKWLASDFCRLVPAGREQALALTNLEQAIFWANAGIARKG